MLKNVNNTPKTSKLTDLPQKNHYNFFTSKSQNGLLFENQQK
jgi:hypothetical protein